MKSRSPEKRPKKWLTDPATRPLVDQWHFEGFDEACKLCTHEKRATVESLYLRAYRISELAPLVGIDSKIVRAHMDALGLTDQRANNTDAFYARVIDLGLESLTATEAQKLLIPALARKDRLNGRDILKVEQLRPTKIIINAPIQTHDIVEAPLSDAQKVERGAAVKALGPAEANGKDR